MTPKILVVDDEPHLEDLIAQKFRRRIRAGEIAFLFAPDGVAALEALAANGDVAMVVSDINMPRMDGLTLLGRLQEGEDPPSTVIVSAYGDMANIRTAMNRGAFDFLTKPIDLADLEATIDRTVRHVRGVRTVRAERAAAERAAAALARYFSPNLAGRRLDVATIFTDVANFTGLVETLEPEVLGRLLDDYLGGMTETIFAHGGTVAKIIGDAVHVLFGAPRPQPDRAERALACALAIDAFAEGFRAARTAEGIPFGATRVGVHAGPAIVGNFGTGRLFEYTAYGDTINTASRLEGANKRLGTRILASAAVVADAPRMPARPVGDLLLRGRSEPLRVFEPLADAVDPDYDAAFSLMAAGDPAALPAFAALVGRTAADPVASLHLRRLLDGRRGTTIEVD